MVGGVPVVAAPEEIDASNADWLRAVLLEAACRGHGTFVVDMTRTQFCDSSGLGVLVRAHNRAVAEGGELRLVIPASAMVLRVFALTGIDRLIPNFPSLGEALEPAPASPTHRGGADGGGLSRGCAPTQTGSRPIRAPAPAQPDGRPAGEARRGIPCQVTAVPAPRVPRLSGMSALVSGIAKV
jgi:anti-sigma B factor antagonist